MRLRLLALVLASGAALAAGPVTAATTAGQAGDTGAAPSRVVALGTTGSSLPAGANYTPLGRYWSS